MMADEPGRSRLGRGLAALMGDVHEEPAKVERPRAEIAASTAPAPAPGKQRVPIEFLNANPNNPRRRFTDTELDELAASIKERGIIQPIVVRAARDSSQSYEIIAGERRWRAAQRANLHDVPIVLIEATDAEALELAIIENVQRTDLNAIEEATGYERLMSEYRHTQENLAKIVGKSRSHVANTLRLLKLSDRVKTYVTDGKISAGHARMLIGQPNAEQIAEDIVNRGLNVRQVEALARQSGNDPARPPQRKARERIIKDADTVALEKRVSDALGLQVTVEHQDDGGILHIRYSDLDQLEMVLHRLDSGNS